MATVHLLCGFNGSGKTTVARRLEQDLPAVRFTLDEWMLRLHGLGYDRPDYPILADRCRSLIWDTAVQVLRAGTDVVLDWNLWNRQRRLEWAWRAGQAGFRCVLHHVDVHVDEAVRRMRARNLERRSDAHRIDDASVRYLAAQLERPTAAEGLEIVVH